MDEEQAKSAQNQIDNSAELPDEQSQEADAANAVAEGSGQQAAGAASAQEGRMDAAKAFFRAMNAGADATPQDFGLNVEQSNDQGEEMGASEVAAGPCLNCSDLEQQLSDTEQKAKDIEQLYRRMAADFENYRKRIEREKEEYLSQGVRVAIEKLMPALDDLERAQVSLQGNLSPEKLLEGLRLVYGRIDRCLEQMGVKVIKALGEPFDPRWHEPVQEIESDHPEGHVAVELRRGYALNDKVIRPSLVNVSAGGSSGVAPADAAETMDDDSAEDACDAELVNASDVPPVAEHKAKSKGGAVPHPEKVYDIDADVDLELSEEDLLGGVDPELQS